MARRATPDTFAFSVWQTKVRGWFEDFLNNWLGNRHVARAVIRYGTTDVVVLTELLEVIDQEKAEEAKKRKLQDKSLPE